MDKLHEVKQRGTDALQVLDNPAYKAAMQALKDGVTEQWKTCSLRDREGQLLHLQLARLTDQFEAILSGMIASGDYAARQIVTKDLRSESALKRGIRRII